MANVTSSGEVSCTPPTFEDYVTAFKRLFVICNIEAWCPAIRSKTAILIVISLIIATVMVLKLILFFIWKMDVMH